MLRLLLLAASLAPVVLADAFRESLTLTPLPDGKLSVLFEFETDFTLSRSRSGMSVTDLY
jgi:phosphatidylinositol glycan class T